MTAGSVPPRVVAALGAGLLAALAVWSLGTGSSSIPPGEVIGALVSPGDAHVDLVIWQVRLPRLVAALMAGSALAVSGAIMQAVTGNPMAEPGIMGVNAGAAFAVVVALSLFDVTATGRLIWIAVAGAAMAALVVYALGAAGRAGAAPVRLVLAGVVVATFLGAVANAILLVDAQTLDTVRFWTVGSFKGRSMGDVAAVLPHVGLGLVVALALSGQFTTLSLGGDTARGLGQNPVLWRAIAALVVAGLAGGAVAVAGPVGFVGLVVPHVARMAVGPDYRRILPLSALGGATLALAADTVPRTMLDRDLPVGVTMALIGAPFFIWLARGLGTARA